MGSCHVLGLKFLPGLVSFCVSPCAIGLQWGSEQSKAMVICNLSGFQASAEQGHLGNWESWTALGGVVRFEESAERKR